MRCRQRKHFFVDNGLRRQECHTVNGSYRELVNAVGGTDTLNDRVFILTGHSGQPFSHTDSSVDTALIIISYTVIIIYSGEKIDGAPAGGPNLVPEALLHFR
jgi:hypothetical protein